MKLFLTVTLCFLIQICFATTFYISPAGSDQSGNGSSNNPWRSLFKATSAVSEPGSVIHVMAGTYTEISRSLLAPGVSIEGEGVSSIIKSTLTQEFVAIIIATSPEGTDGNQHISNIKLDGNNRTTSWGIEIRGRKNFTIHDCVIVDFEDRGVLWGGRDDNEELAPAIYATGNSFYNNIVTNCAKYDGFGRGCLNIGGQEGMLIYHNTIIQTGRTKGTNGWPIKYYNGGFLKGCKIYDNIITKEAYDGISWDFAIELFNEFGLEIYKNRIIGCIDLNHQNRDNYPYGAYIHDNFIGPDNSRTALENGITLEFETNDVIIENNIFNNLGVIVYFTPRKGSIIKNILINKNVCNNIGVAGGRHLGFAIRMGQEEGTAYFLENLCIKNNKFIASKSSRPYWGIGVLGVSKATNILIKNNSIENFSAACIFAIPATNIDTFMIENNNLQGNGWNNMPLFSNGIPNHYSIKKNTQINGDIFSLINLKMNLIRPLYYELKSASFLEFIAIFAFVFSLWFCKNESLYFFPMFSFGILCFTFIFLENTFLAEACISLFFILLNIYGWVLWNKKDKKNHRIIRISFSSKREIISQIAYFTSCFIIVTVIRNLLIKDFLPAYSSLIENYILASALTGVWLTTKKKVESWYWLIMSILIAIPLYFIKNHLLICLYFCVFLFLSSLVINQWKRKVGHRK